MAEQWKWVPGYEGLYRVSDQGRVWSAGQRGLPPQFLKPRPHVRYRYLSVGLFKNGKGRDHKIHRLVLAAFVGPCLPGLETRHLNGNRQDNRLANLTYGTKAENHADKVRHGTHAIYRGSLNGHATLTEDDVREIRRRCTAGERQRDVAATYGVGQTCISKIVRREKWRHVE